MVGVLAAGVDGSGEVLAGRETLNIQRPVGLRADDIDEPRSGIPFVAVRSKYSASVVGDRPTATVRDGSNQSGDPISQHDFEVADRLLLCSKRQNHVSDIDTVCEH